MGPWHEGLVFFAKRQCGPAIAEAETAIAEDPNNADAQLPWLFPDVSRPQRGRLCGVETALRLSPRDPGVPSWQFYTCHLHSHLAQWEQAIEWCNKSVAGDPRDFYPAGRPRRRQRLARSRQGGEGGRGPIAESLSRLHRADMGGPSLDRRSDLQRAICAHRRRPAQGGLPEGEKKTN